MKSSTIVKRSERVIRENAAHSQSDPWVLMWSWALGGLRSSAWLAIALGGGGEGRVEEGVFLVLERRGGEGKRFSELGELGKRKGPLSAVL